MSTDTLERTDKDTKADDGNTDDKDGEIFHYVKKDKIIKSAVDGDHVVALCGEVFPVTKTPKEGSPVCADCHRIYVRLKP